MESDPEMTTAWTDLEKNVAWNVGLGLAATVAAWASWETRGAVVLVLVTAYVIIQVAAIAHSIAILANAPNTETSQRPLLVIPILILLGGIATFITILRLVWNSLILHHLT